MADSNETQLRFEFYVVALIFTLLAVAVNTADFDDPGIPDMIELVAWLLLLAAGLFLLSRLEWFPQLIGITNVKSSFNERHFDLSGVKLKGGSNIHVARIRKLNVVLHRKVLIDIDRPAVLVFRVCSP